MANFYAEIIQKNKELEIVTEDLPYEFSGNIPIKITKDEIYSDWVLVPYFVQSSKSELNAVNCIEGYPLTYDNETGITVLPSEAFSKSGYLFISISLTNMTTKEVIYVGSVKFHIKRTVSGSDTLISKNVWEAAVVDFVDKYMQQHYVDIIQELLNESNRLLNDANTLHGTVSEQQESINNAINTMNGLLEDVEEIKQTVLDQQEEISNITTEFNNSKQDLENKLSSGYFNGSTIWSDNGIPSSDLGKDKDLYINQLDEGDYAQFLFIKTNGIWMPQFKVSGKDGTDTLPLGSEVLIDGDMEVPDGWEEVEEKYDASEIYLENGQNAQQEFDSIGNRVTAIETNGVVSGDTIPVGGVIVYVGDDVPTGWEEVTQFNNHNLLINGDFQCWQRGESFNVTDHATTNGYKTADMILSSYSISVDQGIVSKLNKTGGIKYVSNGYIANSNFYLGHASYDDLYSEYKGKTVTLVVKCRKITSNSNVDMFVYGYFDEATSYKQISIQNTEFQTYVFTFKFNSSVGNFIYRVNNNSVASGCGFEIEYADLFEGDIAYPHIKEDYATALMRCRRKVNAIVNGQYKDIPVVFTYYNNYLFGHILTDLDTTTTVVHTDTRFTIFAISNGQGNIEGVALDEFYFDYTHNLLQIVVPESLRSRFSNGVTCLVQTFDNGKITLTCEPL